MFGHARFLQSRVVELVQENALLRARIAGLELERDQLLTLLKGTARNFMTVVNSSEGEA